LRKRGENIISDSGVEEEIIIWKKGDKQRNSSEMTASHPQKMVMFIVSK